MTSRATVTATCVFFEGLDHVEALVASLRAQTHQATSWVFCVNGPDDGTLDRLAALPEGPRVIHDPDNGGFAGGVNRCLDGLSTSHVLVLNQDARPEPEFTAAALLPFMDETGVGMVGGKLVRQDAGGVWVIDSAGFRAQPWWRIVDRGAGRPEAGEFERREDVSGVCGAAFVADCGALAAVAKGAEVMDERFFMYKEDQDLCLRLLDADYRVIYEPAARARHARGWAPGSRSAVPTSLRRHSLKNRYLLLGKHFRWRRDWPRIPLLLGFEVFLFFALLLREPRTLRGYCDALTARPRRSNRD